MDSKLDRTQQPTSFSSTKHLSMLNTSAVKCDTSRVSLGSLVENGGSFDLDDLQIFSETLNDEELKDKLLGKITQQAKSRTVNCNNIVFSKVPCAENSEGTFRLSSQATTCPFPLANHTRWRYHIEPPARKLRIPICIAFGFAHSVIELLFIVSLGDALFTRPRAVALINWFRRYLSCRVWTSSFYITH